MKFQLRIVSLSISLVLFCFSNNVVARNKKPVELERTSKSLRIKSQSIQRKRWADNGNPRSSRRYAEVLVYPNEDCSPDFLKQVPQAPGSQIQIEKDGCYRMQIDRHWLKYLQKTGAKVEILKEFLLIEGGSGRNIRTPKGVGDDWEYGENSTNYSIPEGSWIYSDIEISSAPPGSVVTDCDVHYEIIHTYIGDLIVDFYDTNSPDYYNLREYEGGSADNINETVAGITMFSGWPVNQTWYLDVADGYSGDTGYIDYWWVKVYYSSTVNSPENDLCSDAISVQLEVPYYGSSLNATGSDISNCGSADTADVWHRFIPPTSDSYSISLCGSSFDTTLTVYDGCGGSELGCNDDSCDLQSELTLSLNASQTYLIRVAGYDGATGNYTLTITSQNAPAPAEPNAPSPTEKEYDVVRDVYLTWNQGADILNNILPGGTQILVTPKAIYGSDDRLDEYQVTDSDWLKAGDSTVILLSSSDLTYNGDGTYSIYSPYTLDEYYYAIYGIHLCADEPFRDQPSPGFCSGVLVAPDIIATAGHCVTGSSDCLDTAFVFGFKMLDSGTPVLTFDESDVYYCAGIIDRIETSTDDWALIQLDRDVLTHAPVPVRRDGTVSTDQDLLIIGYPVGIPVKYAGNAWVQGNTASDYFQANLDSYMGNSGSAVFNADTFEVEGLLVRGQDDFVNDGSCDRSAVYDNNAGDEDVTRATQFSEQIPVFDVYLGTDPNQLSLTCSEVPYPWCSVGPLDCGTNYYWQVVAKENGQETTGPIWVFSTEYVGDLDHDCDVDLVDFAAIASKWMQASCSPANNYCGESDLDKLGDVDLADIVLFVSHWVDEL